SLWQANAAGVNFPGSVLGERKERGGARHGAPVSFLDSSRQGPEASMQAVRHHGPALEVRAESLSRLGERYRRYRLADPHAEQAMTQSLGRWGQLAPVVVCLRGEQWEVVDGFKRLAAARVPGWAAFFVGRWERGA